MLVLAPEFGGAGEQFVFHRDARTPAELRVERAQQRILATGRRGEIGRAVDDSAIVDEHAVTVWQSTDSGFAAGAGYAALATSSTLFPFHR